MRGSVVSKNPKDRRKGPFYLVVEQRWYSGQTLIGRPFRTKKEAHEALAGLLSRIAKNEHVEPSNMSVSDFLERWWEGIRSDVKATTADSYRRMIERHVLPRIGHLKLQRLSASDLKALKSGMLEDGLSARTVEYALAVCRKALGDAVIEGRIVRSPMVGVKAPKKRRQEFAVWTTDQLRQFFEATKSHRWFGLWVVLGTCGLRRGEGLALHWSDVSWEPPQLRIRRSLVTVGSRTELTSTKTDRERVVDLDDFTAGVLKEGRSLRPLVFCQPSGSPLDPSKVSKEFRRLAVEAGLPPIRLHDLRHGHASHLLAAGTPIHVVARRLGHSDPALTLRTYAHLLPTDGRQAAEKIGAVLGALS